MPGTYTIDPVIIEGHIDDGKALALIVDGHTLTRWSSYSFTSSFLTPADSFSFEASDWSLSPEERRRVNAGAKCELRLDGILQASGYLDKFSSKQGKLSFSGRDAFGHVVDSNADPRMKFKPEQSIESIVRTILEPFEFTDFTVDPTANRTAASAFKAKTSKKGKPSKKGGMAKLRPSEGEGCYAFLARVCTRFGFWVWPSVDGTTAILGTPDFSQEPSGVIRNRKDGVGNNVLRDHGEVDYDLTSQPSYVVAEAFGGGGEWGHAKLRVVIVNPFVEQADDLEKELEQYKPYTLALYYDDTEHEHTASPPAILGGIRNRRARPMFKHDAESQNIEQLKHFARRELSMLTRKFMTAKYSIRGHTVDGVVPVVDTVWTIEDEVNDCLEPMWLTSRTLKRSRSAGTTTDLEFIRLNSLLL
jgi:prophage tail gpP-like protein